VSTPPDPDEAARRVDAALLAVKAAGLNVQAVMDSSKATEVLDGLDVGSWPSLLLLGSTGPTMWESMLSVGWMSRPDPVDSWCAAHLSRMRQALPMRAVFVFPSRAPVDVLALGRLAGWAHPSPMGLGIHPRHGLWVGYRGAVLLGAHVAERGLRTEPSPCESCVEKPCISACPGGAVQVDGLTLATCFAQRLASTACTTSCASRRACPVGDGSRYPAAQLAHHQASGNRLYRAYAEAADS